MPEEGRQLLEPEAALARFQAPDRGQIPGALLLGARERVALCGEDAAGPGETVRGPAGYRPGSAQGMGFERAARELGGNGPELRQGSCGAEQLGEVGDGASGGMNELGLDEP